MGVAHLPPLVFSDPAAYVAALRDFMQFRSVYVGPWRGRWLRLESVEVEGLHVVAVAGGVRGVLVRFPRTGDGCLLEPGLCWPLVTPRWSVG